MAKLDEIRVWRNLEADDPEIGSILPDLIELLKNWLLDHVLKEDMQMKHYFNKYHKNFV